MFEGAVVLGDGGGAVELLSRYQFALTAAFHIIYPAMTVGLSVMLTALYGAWWRTGKQVYLDAFHFWRPIFAVAFAIGVVAGIVLTFEFGLNWSVFSYMAGPIVAPIIGWEVLTAFFLEAGFIGILLYGEGRVRPPVMFLAGCMVALGTVLSTTWILSANSWMQTPDAYEVVDGQFRPTNWWEIVFNPSFSYRFLHMLVGALVAASFLVAGVGAYGVRRGRREGVARLSMLLGLGAASVTLPIQLLIGNIVGEGEMFDLYPGLHAAAQGHWDDGNPQWSWIILPNLSGDDPPFTSYGISPDVWKVLDWGPFDDDPFADAPPPGISTVPEDERPNVWFVFYGFHIMMGSGVLMLAVLTVAVVLRGRGNLLDSHRFLRVVTWASPLPFVGIIGGWVTAEAGRQPWVVHGELKTVDALSPLSTGQVILSLSLFVIAYLALLAVFLRFLCRRVREGFGVPEVTGAG